MMAMMAMMGWMDGGGCPAYPFFFPLTQYIVLLHTYARTHREEGHGEVLKDGEDAEGGAGAAGGLGVVHGEGHGGPDDGGDDAGVLWMVGGLVGWVGARRKAAHGTARRPTHL